MLDRKSACGQLIPVAGTCRRRRDVAARLRSEAPVVGVLIGERTFMQFGASAVVEPLPPLRVKDKEEPIGALLLTGAVNESTPRP